MTPSDVAFELPTLDEVGYFGKDVFDDRHRLRQFPGAGVEPARPASVAGDRLLRVPNKRRAAPHSPSPCTLASIAANRRARILELTLPNSSIAFLGWFCNSSARAISGTTCASVP